MNENILQAKPITMFPLPHFDSVCIYKENSIGYYMVPISEDTADRIRENFKNDTEGEGFNIRVMNRTIKDTDIIMFGKSDDWNDAIEDKLKNIIKKNPLVVRCPLDKKAFLVGDRLNTAASIKAIYEYILATLRNPKNVIIFKSWKD